VNSEPSTLAYPPIGAGGEQTGPLLSVLCVRYFAYGQARVSNELLNRGITISPFGVRSIWLHNDFTTIKDRLKPPRHRLSGPSAV